MHENRYYIYILANPRKTVLYTGMTNNLLRRIFEHKQKLVPGFTSRYNCTNLLYFEETSDVLSAVEREKQLKRWNRKKKEQLILKSNPEWKDLYDEVNE